MKKILFNLLLIFTFISIINACGTCICSNPKHIWMDTCPSLRKCISFCNSVKSSVMHCSIPYRSLK